MNNALLYLGGLLVVILAALVGVPYAIDWNGYRGVFEEEASRVLGRDVRVSGDVGLRLLPSPYVHFEKLRIGGAAGEETGRPLFMADGFTMWLSVPPLLKGIVEAREIELKKPVLEISVDAEGRNNLASLQIEPGSLPFVPSEVALQNVRISEGSIGVAGPQGVELIRIDAINGELAADALDGPFRFKGQVEWEGERRDVRINTAKREPGGEIRFKTVVNVESNGNSYLLDATAFDLAAMARVEGTLSAKLSARGLDVAAAAEPASSGAAAKPRAASFDVTSKVMSKNGTVALEDLSISLDHGGVPQLIAGSAGMGWADGLRLTVDLQSKWLDLDHLTAQSGGPPAAVPLELARTLFDRLVDSLPDSAGTNVSLAIDQVGLGNQSLSGVRLSVARAGGPLELKDVRASLPGGTQLVLDGVLEGGSGSRSFQGMLAVSGQSLMRFSKWGFGDNPFAQARSDGPFSVEGDLKLSDGAIELKDARAELNSTPLQGELRLGLQEPRKLVIALEGDRIDLAQLWPGNSGLAGIRALLVSGVAPPPPSSATPESVPAGPGLMDASDLSLDIKAGELIDGLRKLEDVHVEMTLRKGTLSVPRLKFAAAGGLLVDLEGSATGVPDNPRGTLRGLVDAPQSAAVAALSDLLDLPQDGRDHMMRWATLTPWRLGTTFSFGVRGDAAVDLDLDGLVRGGRMVLSMRLDGAREDWRAAPADFTMSVETPDVDSFLETVAQTKVRSARAEAVALPGKLFVKAVGRPRDGLVAVAELDAENVSLDFNGRVTVRDTNTLAAKGDIQVEAQDLRRVLALTGLTIAPGASGIPVSGTLAAAREDGTLTLASRSLKIGPSAVSGVITYAGTDGSGPGRLDADLSIDTAMLPQLLSAISAPATGAAQAAAAAQPIILPGAGKRNKAGTPAVASEPPPASLWPDGTFDLSVLDRVGGTVKASVRSLALEPGLAMKDARIEAALEPGRLNVKRLEGAVLGGKATSHFTLERLAAGAALNGEVKINVSSKGSAESGTDDAIEGDVAALAVTFAGRALSPDAIIGAIEGKGELSLGDVTLSGISPKAVTEVGDATLQGKAPPLAGEGLTDAIRANLKQYQMKLGQITVPVEIGSGALRLARVQVETPDGRATADTVVDLRTMMIDSGWNIEGKTAARLAIADASPGAVPAPRPAERRFLPPVSVLYVGKLAQMGSLEPQLATDALERELAVRRMERDVDELERLRRLDQQRAEEEKARQQALEAERLRKLQEQQQQKQQQIAPGEAAPPPADQSGAASAPSEGAVLPEGAVPGNPIPGDPAAANAAAGVPPGAEAPVRPRRNSAQTVPRKKPDGNMWQPFQMSPYQ